MKVGFTEGAYKELFSAGASKEDMKRIADAVIRLPKREFPVDAFDGLSFGNIELSALRNHEDNVAAVMLLTEAEKLDMIVEENVAAGKISIMSN